MSLSFTHTKTKPICAFFRRLDGTRPSGIILGISKRLIQANDGAEDTPLPSNSQTHTWMLTRLLHCLSAENIPNFSFKDTTSDDPLMVMPAVATFIGSPAAKGVKNFVLPMNSPHALHRQEVSEGLDGILETDLEKNTSIEVLCLHEGGSTGPQKHRCSECLREAAEWATTPRHKPDTKSKQAVLARNRALRGGVVHDAHHAFVEFVASHQKQKEMAREVMAFFQPPSQPVVQEAGTSSGTTALRFHPGFEPDMPPTPSSTGRNSNPSTGNLGLETTPVMLAPKPRRRPVTPFPGIQQWVADSSLGSFDLNDFPLPPPRPARRTTSIASSTELPWTGGNSAAIGSATATPTPFPRSLDEGDVPSLEGGTTGSGSGSDHTEPITPVDQLSTHSSTDELFTESSVDFSIPRHSSFGQVDEVVPWNETPRRDPADLWEDRLTSTPRRDAAGEDQACSTPVDTTPKPARLSAVMTPTATGAQMADPDIEARPFFKSPIAGRPMPWFATSGGLATPRFSPRPNALDLTRFQTQTQVAAQVTDQQVEVFASDTTAVPFPLAPDVENEAAAVASFVASTPKPTHTLGDRFPTSTPKGAHTGDDSFAATPATRAAAETMLALHAAVVAEGTVTELSHAGQVARNSPPATHIPVVFDEVLDEVGEESMADTTASHIGNDSTFDSIPTSIEGALGEAMHSLRIDNTPRVEPSQPFPVMEDTASSVDEDEDQSPPTPAASDSGEATTIPTLTEFRFLSEAQIKRIHGLATSPMADNFHITPCCEEPNGTACPYSNPHARVSRTGLGDEDWSLIGDEAQSSHSSQSTSNQPPPGQFNVDQWLNDNLVFERGVEAARALWLEEQKRTMPSKNTLEKMVKKVTGSVRGKVPTWRKADKAI